MGKSKKPSIEASSRTHKAINIFLLPEVPMFLAWWSISMDFFGSSSGWPMPPENRPDPKRKRESFPSIPLKRCENVSFREGRWEPQQRPNLAGSMLTPCQNHTLSLHHSHHHPLLSHSTFRTTLSNALFHGVKYHISPAMTMLH